MLLNMLVITHILLVVSTCLSLIMLALALSITNSDVIQRDILGKRQSHAEQVASPSQDVGFIC